MLLVENLRGQIKRIAKKVLSGQRITNSEALFLYQDTELGVLGFLADQVRTRKNNEYTFFNKNFHIEPTNICVNHCKFCSYKRESGHKDSWEYNIEQIQDIVKKYINQSFTEVHIVGGVHPDRDIHFYVEMLKHIRQLDSNIHIKAFSAIEIDYMVNKAGISIRKGMKKLKESGLNSIPGGGAEIFDKKVRKEICPDKTDSERWLEIHETAHMLGIPSNATMLYGHIETYKNRIDHLNELRKLQDKTNGFNAFIPLKFRNKNNLLSNISETTTIEDIKNYAISRIYLDNFPHIKAYWPMIGKEVAQLSLSFGVDDIDGTIEDTTKIYEMAGATDIARRLTMNEFIELIKGANKIPVERDSLYNMIRKY